MGATVLIVRAVATVKLHPPAMRPRRSDSVCAESFSSGCSRVPSRSDIYKVDTFFRKAVSPCERRLLRKSRL